MKGEKLVSVASKLYSARSSLKTLFADTFETRCQEWQEVIRKVMEANSFTELEAMLDILQNLDGKEIAQMWVMAATVEMLEPSKSP